MPLPCMHASDVVGNNPRTLTKALAASGWPQHSNSVDIVMSSLTKKNG